MDDLPCAHWDETNFDWYIICWQGHEKEALNLMAAYLPKDNSPGSAFAEGGGLYALGEKNCVNTAL